MEDLFSDNIFCINANDPEDEDLQRIRDIIFHFSQTYDHWGKLMPSRWLLLEDKLMVLKKKGYRVMRLKEVETLNMDSAPALQSTDEILLFLKIHHDIGTVMHYADEGVSDIVILDAQWLVDSLKLVITARRFRNKTNRKDWDVLHEKGILNKKFMFSVWEEHKEKRFFELRDQLIVLMESLDLISSPKLYDVKGQQTEASYFVVLCMLSTASEDVLRK